MIQYEIGFPLAEGEHQTPTEYHNNDQNPTPTKDEIRQMIQHHQDVLEWIDELDNTFEDIQTSMDKAPHELTSSRTAIRTYIESIEELERLHENHLNWWQRYENAVDFSQ